MSTIALASNTLAGTPAAGAIEYNGQFYGTDSNASRAQLQRLVQATSVASTSGTSIDFTNIPAWAKRITVMFNGVSTSGTSQVRLRIGPSGGVETTSYSGTSSIVNGSNLCLVQAMSAGFDLYEAGAVATTTRFGLLTLALLDASTNTWAMSGVESSGTTCVHIGGAKALAGALSIVRITTVNGTDTFDAGSINILYEG